MIKISNILKKIRFSTFAIKERLFILKESIEGKVDKAIFISLLFGFILVLYQISFPKEEFIKDWINHFLRQLPRILMFLYIFKWIVNVALTEKKSTLKEYSIELFIFTFLIGFNFFKKYSLILSSDYFLFLLIITFFFFRFMAVSSEIKVSLMNPALLFAISFLILIFWGTAMLLIPNATNGKFKFVDAAFMSTSAVCVTGLSVVDISAKFTDLGDQILMALFQIGGLGLMTFTNFFALLFRGGLSLRNQLMLSNIVELNEPASLVSVLKKIFFYTFFVEIAGAVLLYLTIGNSVAESNQSGWFFSLFHSVGAFCGAGFSTLSEGLYNPVLRNNYPFLQIISFLVIFGGLGYPVVIDFYNSFKHFIINASRAVFFKERYIYQARLLTVHTKVVITATIVLLVFGTLSFYFLEKDNSLLEHETLIGKLTHSFFGAVVPRSAGFNAVNMGALAQGTILIYLLLMWIGGAPNSTAGGIKVTTFSLAIMNVISLARGKDRVEIFDREITLSSIQRSYIVIFLSIIIIGTAVFLISIFDPTIPVHTIAFECFSAYGTVGLSLNLTHMLSDESKWVLIAVMFLGRVGLFTILFGLFSKDKSINYKYPKESVQVL